MKKKEHKTGAMESRIIDFYQHHTDETSGIPPLFSMSYQIWNIDLERIESIDPIEIKYRLKQ